MELVWRHQTSRARILSAGPVHSDSGRTVSRPPQKHYFSVFSGLLWQLGGQSEGWL